MAAHARDTIQVNDLCELVFIQFEMRQNSKRFPVFLLWQSTSNVAGRQTQKIPEIRPNRYDQATESEKRRILRQLEKESRRSDITSANQGETR